MNKVAISPFGMNPDISKENGSPIQILTGNNHVLSKASLPEKKISQFNTNVLNKSQANNFKQEQLKVPENQFQKLLRTFNIKTEPPKYYSVGKYLKQYPPVPPGVLYREVPKKQKEYSWDHGDSEYKDLIAYTNQINNSGIYPNKASIPDESGNEAIQMGISPNTNLYHIEGRDLADWLWERRGLKLSDAMWDKAKAHRQSPNSQLKELPHSLYHAWGAGLMEAGSAELNSKAKNNQYFNVFNPSFIDFEYNYDKENGYAIKDWHNRQLEPWEKLMKHQDIQDHEASHAFNQLQGERWQGSGSAEREQIFFNKLNSSLGNDASIDNLKQEYNNLFKDTYLYPSYQTGLDEYIGVMSRVKRYGAELGFDTTNPDPNVARDAMSKTLHYLATHNNPKDLTPEQQRINSWLNTAANNHYTQQNTPQPIKNNQDIDMKKYISDPSSPFYKDILKFITDDTMQGLVNNNSNNLMKVAHSNTSALNLLIKQAQEEQDKKDNKKDKPKKYSTSRFEKRVGTQPMTVVFDKRTDGTKRTMNFIRDWDMLNENPDKYKFKPSKGTGKTPDYAKKNLSLVWDLDKNGYRMVNLEKLYKITKFKGDL